jgi:hypothetical protein
VYIVFLIIPGLFLRYEVCVLDAVTFLLPLIQVPLFASDSVPGGTLTTS